MGAELWRSNPVRIRAIPRERQAQVSFGPGALLVKHDDHMPGWMKELLGAAEDVRHLVLVETISILDVVIA
jgi:hypothetical protein